MPLEQHIGKIFLQSSPSPSPSSHDKATNAESWPRRWSISLRSSDAILEESKNTIQFHHSVLTQSVRSHGSRRGTFFISFIKHKSTTNKKSDLHSFRSWDQQEWKTRGKWGENEGKPKLSTLTFLASLHFARRLSDQAPSCYRLARVMSGSGYCTILARTFQIYFVLEKLL